MTMESSLAIDIDALPLLRIYVDGSVQRFLGTATVPPSPDGEVASKDVILDPQTGVFVRIYLPRLEKETQKVPVLVYIHGGAFCVESAASPVHHNYLNLVAKEAKVICVSVDYRRTPEYRLPAAYDDCFSVLQWLDGEGERERDPWIESHADLGRCFVAGDSAGGNIVHHMGIRASGKNWGCLRIVGAILLHPFFGGEEAIGFEGKDAEMVKLGDAILKFSLPEGANKDHPFSNPFTPTSPALSTLVYERILVFVAEEDVLKDRGVLYYEEVKKAGKDVELIETEGENHVFHLVNPRSENAPLMLKQVCDFINCSVV